MHEKIYFFLANDHKDGKGLGEILKASAKYRENILPAEVA